MAKPILVGHSAAGNEITSVASLHSDRIGGLVYLDAAFDPKDMLQFVTERGGHLIVGSRRAKPHLHEARTAAACHELERTIELPPVVRIHVEIDDDI